VTFPLANVAIAIWLALAAGAVVSLCPRHKQMRMLALLLVFQAVWWLLHAEPGAPAIAGSTAGSIALFFLINYLFHFGAPPSLLRRLLANAAYVLDGAIAVAGLLPLLASWFRVALSRTALVPYTLPLEVALDASILASCVLAYVASQGQWRLAMLTIGPAALVVVAMLAGHSFTLANLPFAAASAAALEMAATVLAAMAFVAAAAEEHGTPEFSAQSNER
jgi:hypothetical protein